MRGSSKDRRGGGMSSKSKKTFVFIVGGILLASVVAGVASTLAFVKPSTTPQLDLTNLSDKPVIMRIHPHLTLRVNGNQVGVPAGIGINPSLWADHSLDKYGTLNPPAAPIHTQTSDGTLYVESNTVRDFTFGDFMKISGLDKVNITTIKMTVDGQPVSDYKNHVLKDGEQIVVDLTSP